MKKIVLCFMIFAFAISGIFAQTYDDEDLVESLEICENEVYLTAGTSSFVGVLGGMVLAIAQALVNGENQSETEGGDELDAGKTSSPFTITAGYNHYFWNHLGVGGFISYESISNLNLLGLQAKVTGQYGWEHFKFYHAFSGGILVIPDGGVIPILDVTLLGLKADFDNFNIFLEACMPSTALIKVGASYKF